MQGHSLRDSHRKNKWTQSCRSEHRELLHFWSPTPPQGPFLWGKKSTVQAHDLGPHKLLPSPTLAPFSLSDASTMLDPSTGQALFMPPGSDRHHLFPQHNEATMGGRGRTRRRRCLMKKHPPAGNPLWWEHCTCAEAVPGSRGRGGAPWCAGWAPGQQGAGSLTPSSAFSPPRSPFSSVPPPVEPWLQPWIESNAKFKIKSVLNLDHYEGQMNKHDKRRKMFYIIQ